MLLLVVERFEDTSRRLLLGEASPEVHYTQESVIAHDSEGRRSGTFGSNNRKMRFKRRGSLDRKLRSLGERRKSEYSEQSGSQIVDLQPWLRNIISRMLAQQAKKTDVDS